jgi:hypothetical protein
MPWRNWSKNKCSFLVVIFWSHSTKRDHLQKLQLLQLDPHPKLQFELTFARERGREKRERKEVGWILSGTRWEEVVLQLNTTPSGKQQKQKAPKLS